MPYPILILYVHNINSLLSLLPSLLIRGLFDGWWEPMASLINLIREWTKPLVPTVFPAASPSIQAYQRQSLNFANGQLSVSLKDRPGLDLGETLWNIQLSPYKETGGSNQSQS